MKSDNLIKKIIAVILLIQIISSSIIPCLATELETETTEIKAEELDLGDYRKTMTVGEKQLLCVTALPLGANQTITYRSSNEAAATVNGMGRITAIAAGETTISVKSGKVKESFALTISEAEPENTEAKETTISAADIEISDYETELEVEKTMTLSASVLPADATDTKITYQSDNPQVATVKSTGEIKGIAPGIVNITLTAGTITKVVTITVKVGTTAIKLNSTYVILKSGEDFQLSAKAEPAGASQSISYRSSDSSVAEVSTGGKITAKSIGTTTILVSNGDSSNAVTVIVNSPSENIGNMPENGSKLQETIKAENTNWIINELEQKDILRIQDTECGIVTKEILKLLFGSGKTLQIEASDYTIAIQGNDIINYNNELETYIKLKNEKNGMSLELNNNNNLPGKITLGLKSDKQYKYIYLFNTAKQKYERLDEKNLYSIRLDIPGKYLLTAEKLHTISIKIVYLILAIVLVVVLVLIYILTKKKYWFW